MQKSVIPESLDDQEDQVHRKQNNPCQQDDIGNQPQKTTGNHSPAMLMVELAAAGKLFDIIGFYPLMLVPPGALTKKVGANL